MVIPSTLKVYEKLVADSRERLKELNAINQTTHILAEGKSIEESLQQIVMLLPQAWQYPEHTVARIKFNKESYTTAEFKITKWVQRQNFETIDQKKRNN